MVLPEDQDIEEMPDVQASDTDLDVGQQASAESSTTQPEGAPEQDTLSIVRNAVDEAAAASAVSPTEGQEAGQEAGDQQPKKEPGPDDYDGLPFSRHPRFRQLIAERKDLLEQTKQLKALEPDAQRYRTVQTFLDTNRVPAEEASNLLFIAAQAKLDPVGALEKVRPIIEDLERRAGAILPRDLQEAVQAGKYTPEVASEISRLRAEKQSYQTREQVSVQEAQQRQTAEQVRVVQTAVSAWEADRKLKDPRFEAKSQPMERVLKSIFYDEGMATTPQGARDQLERAYAAVNAQLPQVAAPTPQRRAITPVTGGQVNGSSKAAAFNSTLDVVRALAG